MSNLTSYYTSIDYIKSVFNKTERKYAFDASGSADYQVWKESLKSALLNITGINRMEPCELNPKALESKHMNGFIREKKVIQTELGVWMPFYILIPDDISLVDKNAVIIAAHGHGSAGKESIAGNMDIPAVKTAIEKYNYDYGRKLARAGYIVFCPDARGTGERREWMNQGDSDENLFSSSCNNINNAAISLGRSLAGMWTWDLMRLIDYIENLDFCDNDRIGCCGFSGGGMQTLWLASLDDRIKCAFISGYFHSLRDTVMKTNLCGCNFVPHLWETAEIGDIGALIAPRGLLVESGKDDPLNGERGILDVHEQLDITRKAYSVLNAKDKLYHYVFKGGHQFDGSTMLSFFKEQL